MRKMKKASEQVLTIKVAVNFNVLGPLMEDSIVGDLYSISLVNIKWSQTNDRSTEFRRRSQIIKLLADDMDVYYASAEDFETAGFFFHFQEIRDVPMNAHHPVVER